MSESSTSTRKKQSTRHNAILLARAAVIKSLVQLLTPIVLVRLLDQTEFGEYRLFWLVANTATLLLPLGMARSLLYFLPKSSAEDQGRYISQTAFYFLGVSILASASLLLAEYWLPESVAFLTDPQWIIAAFVFLWLASTPVRYLPNADQNFAWQAGAVIAIAILRAVTVVGTAWYSRDIQVVFWGLLVWATLQFLIMSYYIWTRHRMKVRLPTVGGLTEQLVFVVPFGLSQTLAGARRQVAQWIVVLIFSPALLAVFAIGTSFNAILNLVRGSLGKVILPKMSRSQASGDTQRAIQLNSRGNVAIFAIVAPTICWLWTYAQTIISLMYTEAYLDAVPVLRIYLIVLIAMSIELGSVLMVLEQGRFVLRVSGIVLIGSSVLSFIGGHVFGLAGVALGGLIGEVVGRVLNFSHVARLLDIHISELQDWSTLARILISGIAAAFAGALVSHALGGQHELLSVSIGSIVFAVTYLMCVWIFGLSWLLSVFSGKSKWD